MKSFHHGKAASVLKTLVGLLGDNQIRDFTLTSYVEKCFSIERKRGEILTHFTKVSKEYPP